MGEPNSSANRNGKIGLALGGIGHELINMSRHEISLSFVRVSASGCTHSVQ